MDIRNYIHNWFKNFLEILHHELRLIFTDGGVILIFFVAGLGYPLLYNVVYYNGIVENSPVAVVDMADCQLSRRFIRKVDATRECAVAYKCENMAEAEKLMKEKKANAIFYFPSDFAQLINDKQTAHVSVYADMGTFLYYKNAMVASNLVMLDEVHQIQLERFSSMGMGSENAWEMIEPVPYEANNPYNNAFSYRFFLVTVILFVIIQQLMFYGMSLLVGTAREENRSFATMPDSFEGLGIGRIVLGRGMAYWLVFMIIGIYITFIVPAIFGLPQRGDFFQVMVLLMVFVTDCVFFCEAWSSVITRRESVFILFLFVSVLCVFLSGSSWPTSEFPKFWKWFSYLFPTTFGCQAFLNMNAAGGSFAEAQTQFAGLFIQTICYYCLATIAVHIENWILKHKEVLKARKAELASRAGIDEDEDRRIIAGE